MRITTGGMAAPFADDWSCGIKLGDGEWPDLVAEPLFAADLLPVCTPRLAAQLKRPADLKGTGLLRVAHSPDDWPRWLKSAGVSRVTARGPELQYYGQALQAAADGFGVAMGIRPYIDDDLAAGRLVAPFDAFGAEGHALVPGLSRLPHRAARLCRVPALDRRRRGGHSVFERSGSGSRRRARKTAGRKARR